VHPCFSKPPSRLLVAPPWVPAACARGMHSGRAQLRSSRSVCPFGVLLCCACSGSALYYKERERERGSEGKGKRQSASTGTATASAWGLMGCTRPAHRRRVPTRRGVVCCIGCGRCRCGLGARGSKKRRRPCSGRGAAASAKRRAPHRSSDVESRGTSSLNGRGRGREGGRFLESVFSKLSPPHALIISPTVTCTTLYQKEEILL
jgi:hypothetical protein